MPANKGNVGLLQIKGSLKRRFILPVKGSETDNKMLG